MITLFLILLILATLFRIFPPQNINSIYVYRTSKSKKNLVNWKIANRYSANLMLIFMSSLLLISLILNLIDVEFENILIGMLLFSFVIIIVLTEKKISNL
jgi:uncharacterized membrane protein